ncbi:hypothetical protein G9A89_020416 [Geosiphon pyriformis]|nr:hypothetical protein G9A89_020416 [Geosiphon pyriformis]
MGNTIEIPEGTIIEYLTTKIEDQLPNTIPDFSQLNLDSLQHMQLKMLLNNFNDIFASKNEFGRTNIIQHQIKTRDMMPIKQRAYRVPPASHEIIYQEINQMLDNGLI